MHVVQFLLKNDQRCAEPDMTEMHVECSMGLGEKEALVRGIPTISKSDSFGLIPLHYASCAPATLRILIDVMKQTKLLSLLCVKDKRGNTPLHCAATAGRTESVKMLMKFVNLLVNRKNSDGDTPLHLAVSSSCYKCELIAILISDQACNPSLVNNNRETPLQIAVECDRFDCVEILIISQKCTKKDLKDAIKTKYFLHKAVAFNCTYIAICLSLYYRSNHFPI